MEMNEKHLIGDEDYYNFCYTEDTRYWEIDLITNFSTFQTLLSERDDICFVENLPKNYGEKKEVPLGYVVPPQYTKKSLFTTAVYRSGHYATLSLNTDTKEIHIYDGLFCHLKEKYEMWKNHIDSFIHLITGKEFMQFQFKFINVTKLDTFHFVQNDSYNCRPIACITMWYLASTDKERKMFASSTGVKSFQSDDLRKTVIDKMKSMNAHYSKHMHAYSRFETFEATTQDHQVNPTTYEVDNSYLDKSNVCDICCEIITDTTDCHIFTSCSHKFHCGCLQPWHNNDDMLTCPTCLTCDFQTSGLVGSVINDIKSQGTPVNLNCKEQVRLNDNNQCEVENHQLQIKNRDYANEHKHLFKDKQSKKWLLGAKKENNISISDFVAVSFDEHNHGNWMSACLTRIVFNIF